MEGSLGVVKGEGCDERACEDGFARAGGSGDEDVSDVGAGEAEEQGNAVVVEAENGREGRDDGLFSSTVQ